MNKIENAIKNMWVLCHNGINIFHITELKIGENLETGQPYIECFDTEEELQKKINVLNK
jgi:hypothetical protein